MSQSEFSASTPLLDCLRQARAFDLYPFHMPGHVGGRAFAGTKMAEAMKLDTTELAFTDNLLDPREGGPLLEAEELAARYWQAPQALFLAQGSTQGIQAMLWHYVGKGGRLLVLGSAHKAVWHQAEILELEIVSLQTSQTKNYPMPLPASPTELQQFLAKDSDFQAVFVTSPDYYGTCADLAAYKKILGECDIPLLVDGAHGAHLAPQALVADAMVLSAHKTLPALTGGAVLLCQNSVSEFRHAADLFGSSSPSLLIAASVDFARAYAQEKGEDQRRKLSEAIVAFREDIPNCYQVWPSDEGRDPLRLVVDVSAVASGIAMSRALAERGIAVEMADLTRIVCIVSLAMDPENLKVLGQALKDLSRALAEETPWRDLDQKVSEIFGRAKACSDEGLAEDLVLYPPGVPLFHKGEVLTKADRQVLAALRHYGLSI